MKKILAAATAVAAIAVGAPAFAQSHVDGSISYQSADADDVTLGAVQGRISWLPNSWLGLEAEASVGINDDTVTVSGTDVAVELKHDVGVYASAGVPFGENNRVFARVGYGSTKIEGSSGAVSVDDSDESWRYGVGAQFLLDGKNGFRMDYTKYDFDAGGDANVWSIGYVRRFQ